MTTTPDTSSVSTTRRTALGWFNTPMGRFALILAATLGALAIFQFAFITGPFEYTMSLRSRQITALVIAGVAVGLSSVLFQTISGHRILTPGIMGFDALYMLINTVIVIVFGARALILLPVTTRAIISTTLLVIFGVLLFRSLFRRNSSNLVLLVLTGVVLNGVFSSITSLASRMLSPTDFLTLQDLMFASFNTVKTDLLWVFGPGVAITFLASIPLWRTLDVLDLGKDTAIALGVSYHRVITYALLLITLLVAFSTTLVGPITFLGLVVANLARAVIGTHLHRWVIPASALVGVAATVGGQLIVQHVFNYTTTLSVVVNLAGGLYFLFLLRGTFLR